MVRYLYALFTRKFYTVTLHVALYFLYFTIPAYGSPPLPDMHK